MTLTTFSFFLLFFQITFHGSHAIDSATQQFSKTKSDDASAQLSSAEITPNQINTINALGHILNADDSPKSDTSDMQLQEDLSTLHEPDFLLIGVVKSGSTSLYHYMVQHPEISGVEATFLLPDTMRLQIQEIMRKRRAGLLPKTSRPSASLHADEENKHEPVVLSPGNIIKKSIYDINNFDLARMIKPIIDQKEIRFFDSFWYNHLQTVTNHSLLTAWKWYLEVFNQQELPQDTKLLRGEASPTYFASSQFTAERIKLWLPNIKLILLLRNPVRRFVSHLKMIKENHASNLRFRKQRELEVKRNTNRSTLHTDGTRRLLEQMGYNTVWGNPLNNPYNGAPHVADSPFVANSRYGRNKNRERMKRNPRERQQMQPFMRTRERQQQQMIPNAWNNNNHEDDEYINQEASMYEEQRQSMLRGRGRNEKPNGKEATKRKKPVNKMEKIIGSIYKLSIYQVILVSNANPESCNFYAKRWGITRDVTGFMNRLLFGGIYTQRMKEWLKRFDDKHLFYRESSELFNNPVQLMKELEEFLDVRPLGDEKWRNITNKVYNVELERGKGYQHKIQDTQDIAHWDIDIEKETLIMHPDESRNWLSQEIIALLKDYYKPHNEQLSQLFNGVKYDGWDYLS